MRQSLFVRQQKEIRSQSLDKPITVQMDGVISETHTNTIELTKNPVENGVVITDHAIITPRELVIVGVITDTPFGTLDYGAVRTISGLLGASTSNAQTRSQQGYASMVFMMNQREFVTIQTELELYTNFIITNLTTGQDATSAQSAHMTITLTEVLVAKTLIEAIGEDKLESGAVAKQASSVSAKGKVQTKELEPEAEKTYLKTGLDWLRK